MWHRSVGQDAAPSSQMCPKLSQQPLIIRPQPAVSTLPLCNHKLWLVLSKLYRYLVAKFMSRPEWRVWPEHFTSKHFPFLCRLFAMQSVHKGRWTPQSQTATCHTRKVQQVDIWVHVQRRIWSKINKPFAVGMSKSSTNPSEPNVKLQVTVSVNQVFKTCVC